MRALLTVFLLLSLIVILIYPRMWLEHKINALLAPTTAQVQFDGFSVNNLSISKLYLDEDQASSIASTRAEIDWPKPRIKSLHIDSPQIFASTQELSAIAIVRDMLFALAPQKITLSNADLTLSTEQFGVLTVAGNLFATRNAHGQYELQADLESLQKTLSAHIGTTGTIGQNHAAFNLDIGRGKLHLVAKDISLTRVTGDANIALQSDRIDRIELSLQAGGVRHNDQGWHQGSLSFKQNDAGLRRLIITAKPLKDGQDIFQLEEYF